MTSATSVVEALRPVVLVAAKDLRAEARSRSVAQGVVFYAVLAVLLFSFAIGPDEATLRRFAPGLLWLAVALASLLALARPFAAERDQGTLEGLLLFPVAREALFLGKLAASFVLMIAVAAIAMVLMLALYGLPTPESAGLLAAGLLLGALGLAVFGTFYGALGAQLQAREALIPMLLLPGLVPLLISATQVTAASLSGGAAGRWLALLAAFDAVALALSMVVFPYLIDA